MAAVAHHDSTIAADAGPAAVEEEEDHTLSTADAEMDDGSNRPGSGQPGHGQLQDQKDSGVTRPKGCRMSIIEAVWKPDELVRPREQHKHQRHKHPVLSLLLLPAAGWYRFTSSPFPVPTIDQPPAVQTS